jgi:hypothetical protein
LDEPAIGTVEALVAKVEALPPEATTLELFVPQNVTLQGRPVPQDLAMALVVDKLLARGLFPRGFDQRQTGRRYKYALGLPK